MSSAILPHEVSPALTPDDRRRWRFPHCERVRVL